MTRCNRLRLLLPAGSPSPGLVGFLSLFLWAAGCQSADHRPVVAGGASGHVLSVAPRPWRAGGAAAIGDFARNRSHEIPRSVRLFGATGDGVTDDTAALQAALDGAERVFVPEGTFRAEGLVLTRARAVLGIPGRSVLQAITGANYLLAVNPATQGSPDPADNVTGVILRGLELRGRSDLGFQAAFAGIHNLILSAASDVRVERCVFRAFRGDGIYVGCYVPATERHNEDIVIRDCLFDGVNQENRNGISVTDATRLLIENCTFRRSTAPDQPGAIDIEPEPEPWHRIRDVHILGNRFEDIGGSYGAVAVGLIAQSALATPARNIVIRGNHFDRVFTAINLNQAGGADGPPLGVRVEDNTVLRTSHRSIGFLGIRGMTVARNRLLAFSPNPIFFAGANADIVYRENTHRRTEMAFDNTTNLVLAGNRFTDAGNNTWAFLFSPGAATHGLVMRDNIVEGGNWTRLVKDGGAHAFGPTNLILRNVHAAGLPNDFE